MNEHILISKTGDVTCGAEILRALRGDFLNSSSRYDILDYLSRDIDVLTRRSRIFSDTLRINGMSELIGHLASQLGYVSKMVKLSGAQNETDRGLYSVKQLEVYFDVVESASDFYRENEKRFTSDDLIGFFGRLDEIRGSEEYKTLRENTKKLIERGLQ